DAAAAADKLELADSLAGHAQTATARLNDLELRKTVAARATEIKRQAQQFAAADKARETLRDKPDDLAASLVLGKYLCLVKQDWPQALPLLAKSGDAKLAPLAKQDLQGTADAAEQVKL